MWPPDPIFGWMLLAGLAGGVGHCIGMCGPLVVVLGGGGRGVRSALVLHAGRLLSYALIGGGLALVSGALSGGGGLPGRRLLLALAGVALLAGGLAAAGIPWVRVLLFHPRPSAWASRLVAALARSGGHFALGLAWGLLPCGLLYTAYAAAVGAGAAAGNPALAWLRGATVMLLFGLGTTPTLLGIGWAAARVPPRARLVLQRVAAALVAASGVLLLVRAFGGG